VRRNGATDVEKLARVADWLRRLIQPGQVVEMRALGVSTPAYRRPHTEAGFFDHEHLADMAKAALSLSGRAKGVYFTLNPLKPDLLARRANRIQAADEGALAKNGDVLKRRLLLVDADPVRDPHISATDEEKAKALAVIRAVREYLRAAGWPDPILTDSGNGYHLLYRIDLPADDGGLVERALKALGQRFDSAEVKIDKSVHNAARICKVPGTLACKGDSIPARPHREASLLEIPQVLLPVPRELLEALAATWKEPEPAAPARPAAPSANGHYDSRLLVERWLQARGINYQIKSTPTSDGRTVYLLAECPFNPAHGPGKETSIMQAPSGKMSAACMHDSCAGRGWQEFKAAIGPPDPEHYDPPLRKQRPTKQGPASSPPAAGSDGSAAGGQPDKQPGLTDLGNAERLVARFGGSLRHCHPWRKSLVWDGRRWKVDDTAQVERLAKETVKAMYREAWATADPDRRAALAKHAAKSEAAGRIEAMVTLARSEPGIPILPARLDQHLWLLNCINGTLDLRTGQLSGHRREDYLTRLCPTPYEPAARCPRWLRFLRDLFGGDPWLIAFVQRLLGYCLTGDVREQILPIFWGAGANGKSTIINAVMRVMGADYAMKAAPELLMASRGERHPTEVADLFGMRLVVASETQHGRRLNEALVKDLTGGERQRARRMREDFWEFDPTHKIILLTNHTPVVTGGDHGIWRRLRLVPFEALFWNPDGPGGQRKDLSPSRRQDKDLPRKLMAESAGILAWLVEGCLAWQRGGLTLPTRVRAATGRYKGEEDTVAQFLAERCQLGNPDHRHRAGELYAAYRAWCQDGGVDPLTQKSFGDAMTERGVERKSSNGVWYVGVAMPPR
jgi:P4 family phage/plasmid primase-like protien